MPGEEIPTTAAPPEKRGNRATCGEARSHGCNPVFIPIIPRRRLVGLPAQYSPVPLPCSYLHKPWRGLYFENKSPGGICDTRGNYTGCGANTRRPVEFLHEVITTSVRTTGRVPPAPLRLLSWNTHTQPLFPFTELTYPRRLDQ